MFDRLVASPCCNPDMSLEHALAAYSALGFGKFEAFTSWVNSSLDPAHNPGHYRQLAANYGMRYLSFHLPPITEELASSLKQAHSAARFASDIGCSIVLYKAQTKQLYLEAAAPFLDGIAELGLTPVIQNHAGTPITTLEDYLEVREGIQDPRLRSLLEVGHFHTAGVDWQTALHHLGDSLALVHIKDQVGARSVPFGTGQIDLKALFHRLEERGYRGDYVVELELEGAGRDTILGHLKEGLQYLQKIFPE